MDYETTQFLQNKWKKGKEDKKESISKKETIIKLITSSKG